jgi:hypothetical protein
MKCPRCDYTRKPGDPECPKCGIDYAYVEKKMVHGDRAVDPSPVHSGVAATSTETAKVETMPEVNPSESSDMASPGATRPPKMPARNAVSVIPTRHRNACAAALYLPNMRLTWKRNARWKKKPIRPPTACLILKQSAPPPRAVNRRPNLSRPRPPVPTAASATKFATTRSASPPAARNAVPFSRSKPSPPYKFIRYR